MSDYDRVYLIPTHISKVHSRESVSLDSGFHELYPFFGAPMKGITGPELVIEMGRNNCLGILHRFDSKSKRLSNIDEVSITDVLFGVAISLDQFDTELEIAIHAYRRGAVLIVLDLANGNLSLLDEAGKRLRKVFGDSISLMTGNIVTKYNAQFIKDCGFDFVRVGIGGSKVCATRDVTGIGRSNLAALADCYDVDINLVSDGGINIPANAAKSFAFGADYCMIGSALAYAIEAENTKEENENGNYDLYGMASKKNHILNGKKIKSIEGKEFEIDPSEKKPLKEILNNFIWGLRSTCTYLGCDSYKDIKFNCEIVRADEELDLI